MKRILFVIIISFLNSPLIGQELLSYDDYMLWVRSFHPVAKQADITVEFGEMELRASRGGFDPRLYGDYEAKRFKNTNYYDKREGGIVIPTMAGVELKGLIEYNTGTLLNPELEVPDDGLVALGASVNLAQGLLIDKRRAALRQAQVFNESTKAERIQILNDLYMESTEAYWSWAADYQNVQVLEGGVKLAEERFEMVKESYIQGDFPAIDTVEAYTQVMDRIYRLQTAQILFFKSTQFLNTFLWDENDEPVDLLESVYPENVLDAMVFDYSKESMREYIYRHPQLLLTDFDIESLQIERRYKANMLLPVVKVNYNFLVEQVNEFQLSPFLENNYKLGMTFSMPLFLRGERGNLGLTKSKINFKTYERDLKLLQLTTKLESEIYNFETVERQLGVYTNNVNGLQKLLKGEMMRFEVGESSLFLVNAREVSLISARTTLNELAAKRKSAYAKMLNAAGLGFDE
ncbi:Outer membrane protein TolC [Aquiflexum balticum DSM 16537]|uniref:Outer membrane protein TolC n=1 Tax=Aquiflexum balticum DSM 16537 TaxID=758820 RepID=A0A1W2H5G2_9BACT|nr:TolC family protein [Aquiflexum balticum]SMD43862.1 Outer membrane protein TolC [Aquiflexum balticum DSM 16537]